MLYNTNHNWMLHLYLHRYGLLDSLLLQRHYVKYILWIPLTFYLQFLYYILLKHNHICHHKKLDYRYDLFLKTVFALRIYNQLPFHLLHETYHSDKSYTQMYSYWYMKKQAKSNIDIGRHLLVLYPMYYPIRNTKLAVSFLCKLL